MINNKTKNKVIIKSHIVAKLFLYKNSELFLDYITSSNKMINNKTKKNNSTFYYTDSLLQVSFKSSELKNFYKIISSSKETKKNLYSININSKSDRLYKSKSIFFEQSFMIDPKHTRSLYAYKFPKIISKKVKNRSIVSSNILKHNLLLEFDPYSYIITKPKILALEYQPIENISKRPVNFTYGKHNSKVSTNSSEVIIKKKNIFELSLVLQSLYIDNKHLTNIFKNITINSFSSSSKIDIKDLYKNLIDSIMMNLHVNIKTYNKSSNNNAILLVDINSRIASTIIISKQKHIKTKIVKRNNMFKKLNKFLYSKVLLDLVVTTYKNKTNIKIFVNKIDNNKLLIKELDIVCFNNLLPLNINIIQRKQKKIYLDFFINRLINKEELMSLFKYYFNYIKKKKITKYVYIILIKLLLFNLLIIKK